MQDLRFRVLALGFDVNVEQFLVIHFFIFRSMLLPSQLYFAVNLRSIACLLLFVAISVFGSV